MGKYTEWAQRVRAAMDVSGDTLTDVEALDAVMLFKPWIVGEYVKAGERRRDDGVLYECRQEHTTQADWKPAETHALWKIIVAENAGTIDDPITAARGMEYTYGLYYIDPEDNNVYLCYRENETGVIVLQYLPHELINQYFVAV